MEQGMKFRRRFGAVAGMALLSLALSLAAGPAQAWAAKAPEDLLPGATPPPSPAPAPTASGVAADVAPAAAPVPVSEPVMHWSRANVAALLTVIAGVESEGLLPADYRMEALRAALAKGESAELDSIASKSFAWLAEDLRDGRTPMEARVQWFAVDPDQDAMPTAQIMATALETADVAGALTGLAPTHPDYAVLRKALAETPRADTRRRALIRANMDRWRWLARELGAAYLITNVPEFQLRLTVNDKIIRTYRTIVGKPGKTATPQLAETVEAVVFNPTWTVPQSIVKGEGLGERLLGNPRSAKAQGYAVSRAADGTITVVQQPGPRNSLGLMKIDMPNPHAIYLHDTPGRELFNAEVRAFSHGCIRTERAVELGMTMAILGAGITPEQAVENSVSGLYTRVTMTRTFPVYLTYFTIGQDITGKLSTFADIYDRDTPVLASFEAPRQPKTTQRASDEEVIQLDNPL